MKNLLVLTAALSAALLLPACSHKQHDAEAAKAEASAAAPAATAAAASNELATMAAGFESRIQEALAMPHRSAENRARDQYRHPAETLSFFGLTETMSVLEITPGAGWYTEILAPLLKSGSYMAAVNDPSKTTNERAKTYFTQQNAELDAKFKANADLYGSAKLVLIDAKTPNFGANASVDMVLTFRNAHNWMGQGTEVAMFKGFFDVLKPGGVLGVTDHRAAPGTDWKVSSKSGYVSEESVIALAEAAGFKLEAKSEVNANPKDTRDYADGVWALPPSLSGGDKMRAEMLAIGESDRMTLRFRKPN